MTNKKNTERTSRGGPDKPDKKSRKENNRKGGKTTQSVKKVSNKSKEPRTQDIDKTDRIEKENERSINKKRSSQKPKKGGIEQKQSTKPAKRDKIKQKGSDEAEDSRVDPKALQRGDKPMSIVGHLDELRSRLLVSLISIILITMASFFLSDYFIDIINRPYLTTGNKLNVFNLTEGFIVRLKASLITGILICIPIIVYEIWKYLLPAIEKKDRKFIRISLVAAVSLFYLGLTFTYFLALPITIQMLLKITPTEMANTIGASKYLSFVTLFSLGMGIMFELPIVIMISTRIGIITPQLLIKKRKYAIVLIWIIAAMITPPDVLTQLLLAIPIMLLYEISIVISKIIVKRAKKRELREEQNRA